MSKEYKIVSTVVDNGKLTLYTIEGRVIVLPLSDVRTKSISEKITRDLIDDRLRYSLITIDEAKPVNHYDELEKISERLVSFEYKLDELNKKLIQVTALLPNGVRIENINKIEKYIVDAVENEDTSGVLKLIERMGKVIESRKYETQDLLDFLNTAKLPITIEGDIVFLKSVNVCADDPSLYVDWYTGSVVQAPGTKVVMQQHLVDSNRDIACSTGLHIASLEYVSNFSNDAILMGIVSPEDIIAVPEYDKTKARCSSYRLAYELSKEDTRSIFQGNLDLSTLSENFKMKLNKLLNGDYPPITHITSIHNSTATKDKVERIAIDSTDNSQQDKELKPLVREVKEADTLNVPKEKNPIKPKDIAKKLSNYDILVRHINNFTKASSEDDKRAIAFHMFNLKKKQRKSWNTLLKGDAELIKQAEDIVNTYVLD